MNLYAGIGGNRKLWSNVDVTAIEDNPKIAAEYKRNFPQDNVIVTDAHEYLLWNYEDFDFIWSSPVCKTHSNLNYVIHNQTSKKFPKGNRRYPDLNQLYGEIFILQMHAKKQKWVVENVKPGYNPLIQPSFELHRHLYWSNFPVQTVGYTQSKFSITGMMNDRTRKKLKQGNFSPHEVADVQTLQKYLGLTLSKEFNGSRKEVLRNCVHPKDGMYIFNSAFNQLSLEAWL